MAGLSIPDEPVYPAPLSFFQRLQYEIQIRIFKFIVAQFFFFQRLPFMRDRSIAPAYTKLYAVRPNLKHRVFIPDSYSKGDPPLPLYLDIHGGGFTICDPEADDIFCSPFSNKNKILIVSLDYPLAPGQKFPVAVHSLTDVVKAILQDETIPFDKNKVAIGGFSAGGNLALAVAQDKSLQGKIGGVVGFYPVSNFVTKIADNLATRPKHAPSPDPLEPVAHLFNAAYFGGDQDLRDPLLSVAFAKRESLPDKIFVIGCEFDMLCRDAEMMAEKWAGEGEKSGTEVAWEKNGVKWEKILGFEHGFDLAPSKGEQKIKNDIRARQMYDTAAEWLFREVYIS